MYISFISVNKFSAAELHNIVLTIYGNFSMTLAYL